MSLKELLSGVPFNYGSDQNTTNGMTLNLTDNNESTYYKIGGNTTSNDTVWIELNEPKTIYAMKFKAYTNLFVNFFDKDGNLLKSSQSNSSGKLIEFLTPYENVKKIAVFNYIDTIGGNIYELEAYSIPTNKYLFQDGEEIKKYADETEVVTDLTFDNASSTSTGYDDNSGGMYMAITPSSDIVIDGLRVKSTFSQQSKYGDLIATPKVFKNGSEIETGRSVTNPSDEFKARLNNKITLNAGATYYVGFDLTIKQLWMNKSLTYPTTVNGINVEGFSTSTTPNSIERTDMGVMISVIQFAYSQWQTIGTAPATKEMFDSHGMTDLSVLDNEAIQGLESNEVELLCWTDEKSSKNYTDNSIPVMTSYTQPSGIASASSEYNEGMNAWKAFDGVIATSSANRWVANTNEAWLSYEFPESQVVDAYTMGSGFEGQLPTSWTFEAWSGSEWIVLHQMIDYDPSGWGSAKEKTFDFTNDIAYKKYRINMKNDGDYVGLSELKMMRLLNKSEVSRTTNLTAIPHPQLLLPKEDIEVGEIESAMLDSTVSGNGNLKVIVSPDSGITWEGKSTVNNTDLSDVKANGFTLEEINTLTKEGLKELFPNGKARFAFYLEQEKSTDVVEIHSLTINEKEYTMTPSIESLSVIYDLLESEKPTLFVSRDDGDTWKEAETDELTNLSDLPEGKVLRVKAVLEGGQELHGLSYSWT